MQYEAAGQSLNLMELMNGGITDAADNGSESQESGLSLLSLLQNGVQQGDSQSGNGSPAPEASTAAQSSLLGGLLNLARNRHQSSSPESTGAPSENALRSLGGSLTELLNNGQNSSSPEQGEAVNGSSSNNGRSNQSPIDRSDRQIPADGGRHRESPPDRSDRQMPTAGGRHRETPPDRSDRQMPTAGGRHRETPPDLSDRQIPTTGGRHRETLPDLSDRQIPTDGGRNRETLPDLADRQIPTDGGRHRETLPDLSDRQIPTDGGRNRETLPDLADRQIPTNGGRNRETLPDRSERQIPTDGGRQRETPPDRSDRQIPTDGSRQRETPPDRSDRQIPTDGGRQRETLPNLSDRQTDRVGEREPREGRAESPEAQLKRQLDKMKELFANGRMTPEAMKAIFQDISSITVNEENLDSFRTALRDFNKKLGETHGLNLDVSLGGRIGEPNMTVRSITMSDNMWQSTNITWRAGGEGVGAFTHVSGFAGPIVESIPLSSALSTFTNPSDIAFRLRMRQSAQ